MNRSDLLLMAAAAAASLPAACVPASRTDGGNPAQPAVVSPEAAEAALMSNAACCVCHIPFLKEELSKIHVRKEITCAKCHGPSAGHANDENIGATKPDIRYRRDEIDGMCRKCHPTHNAPANHVIARFIDRKLPARPAAACTDCHGQHRIEKSKADAPR